MNFECLLDDWSTWPIVADWLEQYGTDEQQLIKDQMRTIGNKTIYDIVFEKEKSIFTIRGEEIAAYFYNRIVPPKDKEIIDIRRIIPVPFKMSTVKVNDNFILI